MDITPLVNPELKIIQSYGAGFFRVNGVVYKSPILIWNNQVQEWIGADEPYVPSDDVLKLARHIDILLIGQGKTSQMWKTSQRKAFESIGISVDAMDTASACRTYNILTAEGRRVSAALIPV